MDIQKEGNRRERRERRNAPSCSHPPPLPPSQHLPSRHHRSSPSSASSSPVPPSIRRNPAPLRSSSSSSPPRHQSPPTNDVVHDETRGPSNARGRLDDLQTRHRSCRRTRGGGALRVRREGGLARLFRLRRRHAQRASPTRCGWKQMSARKEVRRRKQRGR
jgi:hypothetical protein